MFLKLVLIKGISVFTLLFLTFVHITCYLDVRSLGFKLRQSPFIGFNINKVKYLYFTIYLVFKAGRLLAFKKKII